MYKVGIFGAAGRFGKLLARETIADKRFSLGACVHSRADVVACSMLSAGPIDHGISMSADLSALLACDVVIDFSHYIGSARLSKFLLDNLYKGALVVGTTALNNATHDVLFQVAQGGARVAVLSNATIGIIVMRSLVSTALKVMPDADAEIVERHHSGKLDAPSGTGLSLARVIAKEKSLNLSEVLVHGRCGVDAKRGKDDIGLFSVRGGSVGGEHSVQLFFGDQILEIRHTAITKDCFVRGALDISYKLAMLSGSHFYNDENIVDLLDLNNLKA